MSEQQAEPISSEIASHGAGPAAAAAPELPAADLPDTAKASDWVESPALVPDSATEAATPDVPKADAARAEMPKSEAFKSDTAKSDTAKSDAAKSDMPKSDMPKSDSARAEIPRPPGKLLIMSAGDRHWDQKGAEPEMESGQGQAAPSQRRLSAMAAVVALAAVAGALGGAMATAGYQHFAGSTTATAPGNPALEASVARIETDLLNLKVSVEHSSKLGMTQFNKTSDRLDKVEKAQAEPAAKLAKLSEAVEKLRAAPPAVAAAPAAAKDVTGSIAAPATAAAAPIPLPAPKPEVARLPTVEGWVLRDVANGGALIEGRRGIYEVYTGDPVPGVGRVDAIRKQDGHWVVVTSKGLIVAR